MPASVYIRDEYAAPKWVGVPTGRFEQWLQDRRYVLAVEAASFCSAEGGYLGTTEAYDLIQQYLDEHPEEADFEEELQDYGAELGEMIQEFDACE